MATWIEVNVDVDGKIYEENYDFSTRSESVDELKIDTRYPMGMGEIEPRNTPKCGLRILRFNCNGGYKYTVKLKPGETYRLGPEYGHRVKRANEYRHPAQSILIKNGLPQSILKIHKTGINPVDLDFYKSYDNHCDCHENHNRFYTWRPRSGGKFYSIRVNSFFHLNGSVGKYVTRVEVWPGYNPDVLSSALKQAVRI